MKPCRLLLSALAAACLAAPALAQDAAAFPQRPIRIIVPFAPGGGTDILARSIAQEMSQDWHVPVTVDNRAGGATVIGTEQVAHAAADGYTLLLTANPFSVNPSLLAELPYNTRADFAPITRVAISPLLLVTIPSMPVQSVTELIALARAKPGALNYASSGIAGPEHLAGAILGSMSGIDIVHVPFRGSGPAIAAMLGGHVQMSFTSMISALSQVKAGALCAVAVSSTKRSAALPDIPAIAETPGLADYEVITWYGVLAPAGTPPAVVAKLNAEIIHALDAPSIRARLAEAGSQVVQETPEQFAAFIDRDMARYHDIIVKAGIHSE
jgi:tripartite-type tricarboxylate transporter receptor subunit TctC